MKLIVKELIESSAKTSRMVDSNSVSLIHFFLLLEQILKHGLKRKSSQYSHQMIYKTFKTLAKRGLFETKRDLWNVIELVERLSSDASDITVSARQIPTIRYVLPIIH